MHVYVDLLQASCDPDGYFIKMSRALSWYVPEKNKRGAGAKLPLWLQGGWGPHLVGAKERVEFTEDELRYILDLAGEEVDTESVEFVRAFKIKSMHLEA
jgi:hypothetical protein